MSDLSDAYREIAERHLTAAQLILDARLPEIAVFHCYHAFESIACAALSLHEPIPFLHSRKIQRFTSRFKHERFWFGASVLAFSLGSLRNRCLYPIPGRRLRSPSSEFTLIEATELLRRVRGSVESVRRALGL